MELNGTYKSIHALAIYDTDSLDPLSLFTCLPRLKTVILSRPREFTTATTTLITLSHLKSFHLILNRPLSVAWLDHLSCPSLDDLRLEYPSDMEEFSSFINNHRSISSLVYPMYMGNLDELQNIAPQLRHLGLQYSQSLVGDLANGRLSDLRSLRILGKRPSPPEFENLVKARCLPASHPRGQLVSPLSPLEKLEVSLLGTEYASNVTGYWSEGVLIREATRDERVIGDSRTFSWI